MWLAAPSSPNAGGTGPWTAKSEAAKATRSCSSVCGHSWLRCGIVRKLATVRWQRPSPVSGAGETVAALAAHIAEADSASGEQRLGGLERGAELVQPAAVGPRVGDEEALREPERQVGAHLGDALQRGGAGLRDLLRVAGRGEVAQAQARIIVAWPDDPVEIDLGERHQRGTPAPRRLRRPRAARPLPCRCTGPCRAACGRTRSTI